MIIRISLITFLIALICNSEIHAQELDSLNKYVVAINNNKNIKGPIISEGGYLPKGLTVGGYSYHLFYDNETRKLLKYRYDKSLHHGYDSLLIPNTERIETETYIISDSILLTDITITHYDDDNIFFVDSSRVYINKNIDYNNLFISKYVKEKIDYLLKINIEAIGELSEYFNRIDSINTD